MSSSTSPFGQNEWLVEEMYRKFREDPSSVDPSWHEFLVDYSPEPTIREFKQRRRRQAVGTHGAGEPGPAPAPKPAEGNGAATAKAEEAPAEAEPAPAKAEAAPAKTESAPAKPKAAEPKPPEALPSPTAMRPGTARRGRRRGEEHVGVAGRADRDQRARHSRQADDRQPHRHQQPPQAHPRRQDLASPTCSATRSCRRSRSSRT